MQLLLVASVTSLEEATKRLGLLERLAPCRD